MVPVERMNMTAITEENKELKKKLDHANKEIEQLKALVTKLMKDIDKQSDRYTKSNKKVKRLNEKLKVTEENEDDSSISNGKEENLEASVTTNAVHEYHIDLCSSMSTPTSNDGGHK